MPVALIAGPPVWVTEVVCCARKRWACLDQTGGPVPCGNRHQQPIVCSLEWDYPVFWIFCFKLKVPRVFFNIFLLNCLTSAGRHWRASSQTATAATATATTSSWPPCLPFGKSWSAPVRNMLLSGGCSAAQLVGSSSSTLLGPPGTSTSANLIPSMLTSLKYEVYSVCKCCK